MTDAQRYPLQWPNGWKRTAPGLRQYARFSKGRRVDIGAGMSCVRHESLTVGDGLERLENELRRLGASNVVISSNLALGVRGAPLGKQGKNLDDPGVAVFFRLKGGARVLACDKWISAADNMAAIAGHIEAIRAVDRYGVGTLDQAFAGYAALPPASTDWRGVFNFPQSIQPSFAMVDDRYKELAKQHHPDRGGDAAMMSKLNAARDAARAELGA